jgi:hypothetical protein
MVALLLGALITFVPMYATPAAAQLPVMAGRAAGIDSWLWNSPARDARAFVISTDMLAYGGLDASRIPGGVTQAAAISRLDVFRRLRGAHPHAWIGAFGTIMRLERRRTSRSRTRAPPASKRKTRSNTRLSTSR